jgi:predicted Zn-dependent protease
MAGRRSAALCALFLLTLAVSLSFGCWQPPEQDGRREPRNAGPGGREQPLALSPAQEVEVGRRAYEQVMEEFKGRILPANSREAVRVRRVVDRLVTAAEIEPLQREIQLRVRGYRFEWDTHVIRHPQVNAFSLPAGRIFVFTGLLQFVGDNDDQLAAVLAHEIAHALAHHGSERIAREQEGGSTFRRLSYDRMQESEADHIGIFIMTFAGYDPAQAVAFWEKMLRRHDGGPPEFLSDHPSDEHRVQAIREWVPKAQAAKKAFDEGRIAPAR